MVTTTISLDSLKLTARLRQKVLLAVASYGQRCHLGAELECLRDTHPGRQANIGSFRHSQTCYVIVARPPGRRTQHIEGVC